MRIDTGQHMRIDQRMKLAPRMIQSMEILQMPMQALEERLEQELASNPTLELVEPGADADVLQAEMAQEQRDDREGERELVVHEGEGSDGNADDFERLTNLTEQYGESFESQFETGESYTRSRVRDTGERDAKLDALSNTAARGMSLYDQLINQWRLAEAPPPLDEAGEYLIGFIDADGYIRTPRQDLVAQLPAHLTADHLDDGLKLLQQALEPPGLAARDLRECLLLQIDAKQHRRADFSRHDNDEAPPDLAVERTLVAGYLKDVEANRLPRIARETNLPIERIKQAIANLRQFTPHPGRLLAEDSPRAITPDAIVEYDEETDAYVAHLTNGRMPALQVSSTYSKMVKDKGVDKKTREFVGNHLSSARWLIEAIQQRQNTLMRVINVVLAAQRDYFDQGPQALRPLPMTLVADQLGIHVATVSRAVNEKYLQTPRGIVPLRMFFSGGTETETGDAMSWAAVQAKLEEIINAEDKSDPLSDDALVDELKKHGIDIARRTVAKYRKQLNIPTARQRKEY